MRSFLLLILMMYLTPSMAFAAPIHDAARKGDVAAITAALDAGADINASEGGGTPLYFAVRKGHLAAAKLLIERGAKVNVGSSYWGYLLTIASAKTRVDLITLLLANGANPNSTFDGESVLHVAVKFGCLDCVKALVEAGADVNAPTYDTHSSFRTPLHIAIRYGYPEVADYLLTHGVVLPNPRRSPPNWRTPIPKRAGFFSTRTAPFATTTNQVRDEITAPTFGASLAAKRPR